MAKHSVLSPSNSAQWLHCSASSQYQSETSSKWANEGTVAHKLAATVLTGGFTPELKFPSAEMKEAIAHYVSYVWGIKLAASIYGVEDCIEIEPIVGYGTTDFWALEDVTLHVVDLKYGTNRVYAKDNSQLMLYAWGLIKELGINVQWVKLHIVQPRGWKGIVNNHTMSCSELFNWVRSVVQPKVECIWKGDYEYNNGSWCWFCPGRSVCPLLLGTRFRKYFSLEDDKMGNGNFVTKFEVRVVYLSIDKMVESMEGNGKYEYQCTLIIPENDETMDRIKSAHGEAMIKAQEVWGNKKGSPGRYAWEDLLKESNKDWAKGAKLLKLKTTREVACYDGKGDVIPKGQIKNGDYCRVIGHFYPYANKSYGISCYLDALMLVKEGEEIQCRRDYLEMFNEES